MRTSTWPVWLALVLLPMACASKRTSASSGSGGGGGGDAGGGGGDAGGAGTANQGPYGVLGAICAVPQAPAALGSASTVGGGTPESCTEGALGAAVAGGGEITFDCGAAPLTIPITQAIGITKDVHIDGGGLITLDGQMKSRIFYTSNGLSIYLQGLTLSNATSANATVGPSNDGGGALMTGSGCKLFVSGCRFTGNVAGISPTPPLTRRGGGAFFGDSGTQVTVVQSYFSGNQGGMGGALRTDRGYFTVVSSTFEQNSAPGYPGQTGDGGAVHTDGTGPDNGDGGTNGGYARFCGVRVSKNSGTGRGAGIYLFARPPETISVDQCRFEGNSLVTSDPTIGPLYGGAGMAANAEPDAGGGSTLDVTNSSFVGNTSEGFGGGLWLSGTSTNPGTILNATFVGNTAVKSAAAMDLAGTAVENVTVSGNTVGTNAVTLDASTSFKNVIFAGNTTPKAQCGSAGIDLGGNVQWPSPGSGTLCAAGALVADPMLQPITAQDTVPLGSTSPVLGHGTGCPPTDELGAPRQGRCDPGAVQGP